MADLLHIDSDSADVHQGSTGHRARDAGRARSHLGHRGARGRSRGGPARAGQRARLRRRAVRRDHGAQRRPALGRGQEPSDRRHQGGELRRLGCAQHGEAGRARHQADGVRGVAQRHRDRHRRRPASSRRRTCKGSDPTRPSAVCARSTATRCRSSASGPPARWDARRRRSSPRPPTSTCAPPPAAASAPSWAPRTSRPSSSTAPADRA